MLVTKSIVILLFVCSIQALRFNLNQEESVIEEQPKPGFCPRQFKKQQICDLTCDSDADCAGTQKCCLTDCGGRVCVRQEEKTAQQSVSQQKCPAPSKNKTAQSCESCQTSDDCLLGHLCCKVLGCGKSCVDLNPPLVKAQLKHKQPISVQIQDYDYSSNYQAADYDGFNTRSNRNLQNRMSQFNTFQGPMANFQGSLDGNVLQRQANPFYKLEKSQYLNAQRPRFNLHPMRLKMIKATGQSGY